MIECANEGRRVAQQEVPVCYFYAVYDLTHLNIFPASICIHPFFAGAGRVRPSSCFGKAHFHRNQGIEFA